MPALRLALVVAFLLGVLVQVPFYVFNGYVSSRLTALAPICLPAVLMCNATAADIASDEQLCDAMLALYFLVSHLNIWRSPTRFFIIASISFLHITVYFATKPTFCRFDVMAIMGYPQMRESTEQVESPLPRLCTGLSTFTQVEASA